MLHLYTTNRLLPHWDIYYNPRRKEEGLGLLPKKYKSKRKVLILISSVKKF
jgi:hypothetical protein